MCPAPKGNKFALGNSGRAKKFESPEQLKLFIDQYFDWCDANPIIRIEWNGKDPVSCDVPTQRPYTVEGLCLHLDIDRATLLNYQKEKGYEEFFNIITHYKRRITENNITYGMTGAYNANLVKFLLSNNTEYKDKTEQVVNTTIDIIDFRE
jgi:hypothetical protein